MSQDSIVIEPSTTPGGDPNTVQQPQTAPEKVQPPALDAIKVPDDESVPATYRGKSLKDVIAMHENAASRIGEQGRELGVWRNLVGELSQATARKATDTEPKAAPKITSDSLLTDPASAISSVVRHELEAALRPLKQSRELDHREAELQALNRDFPNASQVGEDPEFQKWANGAKGRSADARATAQGDTSAARRLLEAWEDRKALMESTKQTSSGKPQGTAGARAATTESGGSGHTQTTGKIFNRAEVVQLIIDKPDLYNSDAYQAELLQAAKEGRIR